MRLSQTVRRVGKTNPAITVAIRAGIFVLLVFIVVAFTPDWFEDTSIKAPEITPAGDASTRLAFWLEQIQALLVPIIAVGILTSAIVEAFKSLVRPRAIYHRFQLLRWLRGDLCDVPANGDRSALYDRLVTLSAAGDEWALLKLSTEDMINQLNSGLQIALEDPEAINNAALLSAVGRLSSTDEVQDPSGATSDQVRRNTLLIQRRLEALQFRIQSSWASYLHGLSFFVSTAIIFYAYQGVYNGRALIAFSLVGAAVAPIARDLVAAIANARNRLA